MLKYLLLLLVASPCFAQSGLGPGAVILNSGSPQVAQFNVGTGTVRGPLTVSGPLNANGSGLTNIPLSALQAGTLSTSVAASSITPTGVLAGVYGDSTHVATFTVTGDGRITKVSAVAITGALPSGAAGGALAGTYPNPNIGVSTITNSNVAQGTFTAVFIPAANVNAGNLGIGVIASSLAVGCINSPGQFSGAILTNGQMAAGTFSNISIPAQNLISGIVPTSVLPTTVAYTNAANNFTAAQTVSAAGGESITYGVSAGSMTGAGLSTCGDSTHALSWTSATNLFGCQAISAGGGGASALAVTTGSSTGFGTAISSPTSVINFDTTYFAVNLKGSATAFTTLNAPFAAATIVSGISNSQVSAGTFANITIPAANVAAGNLGTGVVASSVASGAINQSGQFAAGVVNTAAIAASAVTDPKVSLSTGAITMGTWPVASGGTGATSYTAGSVLFAGTSGTSIAQNNTKLFWDNTQFRLGIATGIPQTILDIHGTGNNVDLQIQSDGASAYSAIDLGSQRTQMQLAVVGTAGQFNSKTLVGDTVLVSSGNLILSPDITGTKIAMFASSTTGNVTIGYSTGSYQLNVAGSGLYVAGQGIFASTVSIQGTDSSGIGLTVSGSVSAATGTFTQMTATTATIKGAQVSTLTVTSPSTFAQDVQALGSTVSYNASQTINWLTQGPRATILLTGNVASFTMSGGLNRGTYLLELVQDGTGGRTVVWPTNWVWPNNGSAPTLTLTGNARDYFMLYFATDGNFHVLAISLNN